MFSPRTFSLALAFAFLGAAFAAAQNPRKEKVLADKAKVEADGFWRYNDLPGAFAEAQKQNKPLIVVLRCIPCDQCVKLDDNLVDKDPELRPLLEQFVRVRQVYTNGLDLGLFQFDYDQSFAVFFLNADGTIYGRFGTRSHGTNWIGDVSIKGLTQALQGALDLHKIYPANKAALAAKRGPAVEFSTPEKFPKLAKFKDRPDYAGNVVQSCIHCHQIGDAIKEHLRLAKKALPDEILFPYPHPKSLGLILDPNERATVLKVETNTPAAQAGLQAGDRLAALAGQPLLSIADVQWALHRANPDGAEIAVEVIRAGKLQMLTLKLDKGWRQRDNISWRASSWELRRMATGGMLLAENSEQTEGIAAGAMALKVKHVGQYSPHDAAKQAGIVNGDVLVSFAGRTDLLRETDLLAYSLRHHFAGEKVPVVILRDGKRMEFTLTLAE